MIYYTIPSFFDWRMFGTVSSVSHFEIVCRLTPSFCATSSCESPRFFLAWNRLFPKFIYLSSLSVFLLIFILFKPEWRSVPPRPVWIWRGLRDTRPGCLSPGFPWEILRRENFQMSSSASRKKRYRSHIILLHEDWFHRWLLSNVRVFFT